jgi:hypothetical protein
MPRKKSEDAFPIHVDEQVLLINARIEWERYGELRISDYFDESPDHTLSKSGGACFELWRAVKPETRMIWFLWHALMACRDGCHPRDVLDEMQKVPELFEYVQQFTVRPSEMKSANVREAADAIARLTAERDEARREVLLWVKERCSWAELAQEIKKRGWEYLKEDGK